MRIVRLLLFVYFEFLTVVFITFAINQLRHYGARSQNGLNPPLSPVFAYLIPITLAVVFGAASVVIFRGAVMRKMGGNAWVIVASLLSLVISIGLPLLYLHAQGARAFLKVGEFLFIPTLFAVTSLIVYLRRNEPLDAGTHF